MKPAQGNRVTDLGAASLNKMRMHAAGGFAASAKGNMTPRDIAHDMTRMKQATANKPATPLKTAQPQATVSPAKIQDALSNSRNAVKVVNAEAFRRTQGATPMHDEQRWKRTAIGEHKRVVAMSSAMKAATQGLTAADRVLKPRFAPKAPMPAAPAPRMAA